MSEKYITIECECGNNKKLSPEDQSNILGSHFEISKINLFYEKLKCSSCEKDFPSIYDYDGDLLFDRNNLKKCINCNNYISYPRLETLPNTKLCSARCVNENELGVKNDLIEKEIEEKKVLKNHKKIKKNRIIKTLKSEEFFSLNMISKVKNGQITKKFYIREFLKLTWWIRGIIEKDGGRLIDDPRKYTTCPSCKNLAVIIWSEYSETYYIRCSEYKDGCSWTKFLWVYN